MRSEARIIASLVAVAAYVGLAPIALHLFASSTPALAPIYVALWLLGFGSDAYTTYRFYRRDPASFERMESSGYMRLLYRLLGFRFGAALIAFIVLVEVPVALLISLLLIPCSTVVLQAPSLDPTLCIPSGLAFLGISHLSAAIWNLKVEREERSAQLLS